MVSTATRELEAVLTRVDAAQVDQFMGELLAARVIACYGVGREGLEMRGLAMRLYHLGLQAAVVGDMTAPAVGPGDVLVVSAGPGYFSTVAALAVEARRAGARVLLVTASANPGVDADLVLTVPAQTLPPSTEKTSGGGGEQQQRQLRRGGSLLPMGSAYELALQLLFDLVMLLLRGCAGVGADEMAARHTNLE